MTKLQDISTANIGLRAYDSALGFRNLEERSGAMADFGSTHIIGMMAVLSNAIRGQDVIKDARMLKVIAAEVLKINLYAFDRVVSELEELEMVRNIKRRGGEIISFDENIPLLHDNIHEQLGAHWYDLKPSEIEAQFLLALDKLAHMPLHAQTLRDEIGADAKADRKLRGVGTNAELIRYYPLRDGSEIATSPLHAFEHPDQLVTLFENHEADDVREAFGRIRLRPGFPVQMDNSDPIVEDMVRLGLVPAPTVTGADKKTRAFAIIPYGLNPDYLTSKKQVLDRALALIACVRCGEVSGGASKINWPHKILAALKDPGRNYTLRGHSSTPRQYAPLIAMGMIKPVQMGDRFGARLVVTPDNLEAVELACTLLRRQGEGTPERGNEREATRLLFTDGPYLAPIETLGLVKRNSMPMSVTDVSNAWARMRGWQ